MKKSILFVLFITVLLVSCNTTPPPQPPDEPVVAPPTTGDGIVLPDGVRIRDTERGKILVLPTPILFDHNKATILSKYDNEFTMADLVLQSNETVSLILEGHASTVGRAYPKNYELSVRRANAVFDYLVGKNVPADRMSKQAFGEGLPEYPTDEENRRVEFVVITSEEDRAIYNEFAKTVDTSTEVR